MADAAFERVLNRYRERAAQGAKLRASIPVAEFHARRDEFLLDVGEEIGRFLVDVAISLKARVIVELGTSYGFSTLFLAAAARETGGRVFSYDLVASKQAYAQSELADAGLLEWVEFRQGDATQLLANQPGPIDLALIDLWKDLYIPCFELVYPKLAPRGVVVADNMLFPPQFENEARAYRAAVRSKPDIEGVVIPLGSGLDFATRKR